MEASSLPEISDPEFKRSVSALANAAYSDAWCVR